MEGVEDGEMWISKTVAVVACTGMTLLYVAILYSPTVILRLSPPTSFKCFMIRRFICAAVSSLLSLVACALLLPIRKWDASSLLGVYGIRGDHVLQAAIFTLSLTSLMYAGSFGLKCLLLLDSCKDCWKRGGISLYCINNVLWKFISWTFSMLFNVSTWRDYFVAPVTEELVFRACMIPLLLCGGFNMYTVMFLCPIFFSLAHLNHFLEFYRQQNRSLLKTSMIVGFQLGYTVVFGAYASFLFIRTGHYIAPLVAHVFCNFMGLPKIFERKRGIVSLMFFAGMAGFLWFLFPLTSPYLYNYKIDSCKCWNRYCSWI